jgi:transposase
MSTPKKIRDVQHPDIVAAYKSGKKVVIIAEECDVTVQVIYRLLQKYGVAADMPRPGKLREPQKVKLLSEYHDGKNIADLVSTYGVGHSAIQKLNRKRIGHSRKRPSRSKLTEEQKSKIVSAYIAGGNTQDIAKDYPVHYMAIHNLLKARDVLRPNMRGIPQVLTEKTCTACSEELPVSSFSPYKRSPTGFRAVCKKCYTKRSKQWTLDNPEKFLATYRRVNLRKFGITPEVYDAILLKQSSVCAICLNVCPTGKALAVDHSHGGSVVRVRGLLCYRCNIALGYIKDSIETLKRLAAYAECFDSTRSMYSKQCREDWAEEVAEALGTGFFSDRQILFPAGISRADYLTMYFAQSCVCATCSRTNDSGRRLAVDHVHKTGRVRGLLCHRCNVALGQFQDSPLILRRAAAYLQTRSTPISAEAPAPK